VLSLLRADDDRLICPRVAVARSFVGRLRGLMGRAALAPDEGLYLPGTNSIHMLFMRFPIDCVFLGNETDGGARPVVAMRRRLPPWRGVVWYVPKAKGAVEMPAGALDEAGLEVGQLVRLVGLDARRAITNR
jgi:uncharacterized membrane protein (UPF0127 family)